MIRPVPSSINYTKLMNCLLKTDRSTAYPRLQKLTLLLAAAIPFTFFAEKAHARPLGIDVSSYQGSGVNWTSVKNSGRSFAWAKATEGMTVNDSTFAGNQNNGKAAGMVMGAYHFAHPESNS